VDLMMCNTVQQSSAHPDNHRSH